MNLEEARGAWKAAIDRDERQQSAASARRLARVVAPKEQRHAGLQTLRDFMALGACIVACALGGMWLRHTMTTPRSIAAREIRADETQETPPAPIATSPPLAVETARATRPALAPPAKPKAKSEADTLPPLPPPAPAPANDRNRADEDRRKMLKRFEHRIDRVWRRRPPPPRRPPPGHTREL